MCLWGGRELLFGSWRCTLTVCCESCHMMKAGFQRHLPYYPTSASKTERRKWSKPLRLACPQQRLRGFFWGTDVWKLWWFRLTPDGIYIHNWEEKTFEIWTSLKILQQKIKLMGPFYSWKESLHSSFWLNECRYLGLLAYQNSLRGSSHHQWGLAATSEAQVLTASLLTFRIQGLCL